ncbi:hypothetical protein Gbfr_007_087 [Gluconobacter frateurii M-2]|nr:hypothetical protein Gbfr_007_087 [Gluconobacter frateurii M-2]
MHASTMDGHRARAEALKFVGGGFADDPAAAATDRMFSALARDLLTTADIASSEQGCDEDLVKACDALVQAIGRRTAIWAYENTPVHDGRRVADEIEAVEKKISVLMNEIISCPAKGTDGRAAQMRALVVMQGPHRQFETLIAQSRDEFSQLSYVVLRDLPVTSQRMQTDSQSAPAADVRAGNDAVLIRVCGEFVQTMRAKDALMETVPASPEAQAVSDRARELLDDLLVQRATTPEGQKAQMEALKALGRPVLDYEQMIREAPDWFGQVAAAIIRDQAQVMQVRPAEPVVSAPVGPVSPYEAAVRMRRAQKLKDQRIDDLETLEDGQEIRKRRWSALDAQAAESVELLLHDLMPLLPSASLLDAAVQVFAALETLQAVDLEPVGGSAPLYRSENVTRIMRCLSSALPVLMAACGQDLTDVLDPAALSLPEAEHGLFKTLWQGSEVMV